jgi:hypothetical protein
MRRAGTRTRVATWWTSTIGDGLTAGSADGLGAGMLGTAQSATEGEGEGATTEAIAANVSGGGSDIEAPGLAEDGAATRVMNRTLTATIPAARPSKVLFGRAAGGVGRGWSVSFMPPRLLSV